MYLEQDKSYHKDIKNREIMIRAIVFNVDVIIIAIFCIFPKSHSTGYVSTLLESTESDLIANVPPKKSEK